MISGRLRGGGGEYMVSGLCVGEHSSVEDRERRLIDDHYRPS